MKFTLSWLKSHLDTDASVEDIAIKLTDVGLEIEEVVNPGAALSNFIVGHVVEAGPHPDADRLKLCRVETGSETLQIVCGAPNARAGLKVVLARPGDIIPATGDKLKKGKIRGQESVGMMCSARELGLGEDHDGIIELPEDTATGSPAVDALSVDPVFDIALTPNRVDALGVRGIARDLAAAGLGTLKPLSVAALDGTFDSPVKVAMNLPTGQEPLCPQFVGRYVRGVKNAESPKWLKDRLAAIGLRSISALVDITQYLTIDMGRPLHVFDADKLTGSIGPRLANDGETIEALNEKTYSLTGDMVVIADDAAALGIGGVMGGEPSSCTLDTTNVFIESALFDANNIARTGRALQINSDARYCFERGVDPASAVDGAELATAMILELCGGEASRLEIGGTPPDWRREITFRPARVAALGGVDVPEEQSRAILERLGFAVSGAGDSVSVTPPSWRTDIEGEADLVEEVLRINGYDAIPALPLPRPAYPAPVMTDAQKAAMFTRRTLATRGLSEAVTWSFLSAQTADLFRTTGSHTVPEVRIDNPISADLDVMRPSVLPNLITAVARNVARGVADVALFEMGPRFDGPEPGEQTEMVAGVRIGAAIGPIWTGEARRVDAFDAKADALATLEALGAPTGNLQISTDDLPDWYHPGRAGWLTLGPNRLAVFGELHPATTAALGLKGRAVGFEVNVAALPPAKKKKKAGAAKPLLVLPDLQPVTRDFAFVVDADVPADKVLRAAAGADKALITDVRLFDVYTGTGLPEGRKSLALQVVLQPVEASLTDADLDALSAKVVAAVEKSTGGTLRS